jgi:peptidoglycan/LPS O-acetylase OafA/YrhL
VRAPRFATLGDAVERPDNNFNLIRLVAAWAVIFGHSHAVAVWGGPDPVHALLGIKFSGLVAVDTFFLVSGFLIAASLERNRLPAFLASRALRIFPALIACVTLTVLVLGPLVTTDPAYWRQPETLRYFVANVGLSINTAHFLPGVFDELRQQSVNASLWSLPVEARCYLALAGLGALSLNRRGRFDVLFVLALAAGVLLLGGRAMPEAESRVWSCVAFFFTGTFAWLHRRSIPLAWPLLAATIVLAALLRGGPRFYLAYYLALAYGVLYLAYVPKLPVIRRNDLSYGLYLYGWPAQQLVQMQFPMLGPWGNTLGATLLAGTLAAGSWFWIERPAMRLKDRFRVRGPERAAQADEADAAAEFAGRDRAD